MYKLHSKNLQVRTCTYSVTHSILGCITLKNDTKQCFEKHSIFAPVNKKITYVTSSTIKQIFKFFIIFHILIQDMCIDIDHDLKCMWMTRWFCRWPTGILPGSTPTSPRPTLTLPLWLICSAMPLLALALPGYGNL